MLRLNPWRGIVAALTVVCVASCSPAHPSVASFPIIGNDPGGLVETMQWSPAPATSPPRGELEVLEILDSSTPELIQIAVEGGQCPPSAQVSVSGDPDQLSVIIVLGAAIAPAGTECGENPTTHTLEIHFKNPIDLAGLRVTATRTGETD